MDNAFQRLRTYSILALMPLFFSTNIVIGRAAVASVEPWTLAFWRWALAVLVILPIAWPEMARHRTALLAAWRTIALLAFFAIVLCGGGLYVAIAATTATNGTLIYTSSPVFVLLLEMLFRGQRTSVRQVTGITLAFLGVAAILLRGDIERLLALELNAGDIGVAAAAFSWAVYSVLLKREAIGRLPTVVVFTAVAFAGCVLLVPFVLWEVVALRHFPVTPQAWTSIFGLALFPSVLAFTAYQFGIKTVGPTLTSICIYMMPVYGVLLAVVFLGEQPRLYHGAGLVLVISGVALATAPSRLWRRLAAGPPS